MISYIYIYVGQTVQVGKQNKMNLDVCYGDVCPQIHLYFDFMPAEAEPNTRIAHFNLLQPHSSGSNCDINSIVDLPLYAPLVG